MASRIDRAVRERTRPHRLAHRYPAHTSVRVSVGDKERVYELRDVSAGGLFLLDASTPPDALELFAELRVLLTDASVLAVPARVVHLVSTEKSAATGLAAGAGVQFEPKRSAEQLEILAFVDAARRQDPRPRWPLPQPSSAAASARSDPMLGYLLTAIDGTRGPEELSEMLALELDVTDRMLRELAALGAIALVPAGAALPPSHRPRLARRLTQSIHPTPAVARPRGLEPALLIELRALWSKLPELDHYQVLGLTRGAGREQVRKAFYEMSRRFHPDNYYGAPLGDDLAKLERVFGRLSEAYSVLSREGSQTEYHRYLDHKLALERLGLSQSAAKAHSHAAAERAPSEARQPELTLRSPKPPSADPSAARRLWEAMQDRRVLERGLSELRAQAMYEEKHQRWDDAAISWQRLCEAASDDAAAHQAAALALHHTGTDPARAIALARRAVELAPTDAASRRTLGNAYLAQGLNHRARDEFEAAQRLQGETPTLPPPETSIEGSSD